MKKANTKRDMKNRIIQVAMEMFREKSFHTVTVDQIVEKAGTSKGGFYYYFNSKDDLLLYWWPILDQEYDSWYEKHKGTLPAKELLLQFNLEYLKTVEEEKVASIQELKVILANQLGVAPGLIHEEANRSLFVNLNHIIQEGQANGEISTEYSYKELAKMYVTVQRGITYDWLLTNGAGSLIEYGQRIMRLFVQSF